MEVSSRRLDELDFFNGISCLLVVLIHVLSAPVSSLQPDSWQLALVYFPWRIAAFVVPGFLFIGGIKVGLSSNRPLKIKDYGNYLLGRFRKIYIPYIIANIIYYVSFLGIGYVYGTITDFCRYLITGTLSSPFYYIIITMQFYLLFPLWKWLVENVPALIALPVSLLITFVSIYMNQALSLLGISFPYLDRIFPSYLVFWVGGLYAGKNYSFFSRHIKLNAPSWLIGIATVLLFTGIAYLQHHRGIYLFDLNVCKFFTDYICILLLFSLSLVLKQSSVIIQKCLRFVHKASFFVYLSHCYFLSFGVILLESCGIHAMEYMIPARFILGYIFPLCVYCVMRKIRNTVFASKT